MTALLLLGLTLPTPISWDVTVEGAKRTAIVFAPTKKTENPPLVLGFHGHGGTMDRASRTYDLQSAWPEAVVIYPQGLPTKTPADPEGKNSGWHRETEELRDVKLFDALLDRAKKEYKTDKVYVIGHSNGGHFVYVLWAMRREKIAAFAPSAGHCLGLMGKLKPKPAFILGGEQDKVVEFSRQRRSMDWVLKLNGSKPEPTTYGKAKLYAGGRADTVLYVYPDGHRFAKEAIPDVVRFFKAH